MERPRRGWRVAALRHILLPSARQASQHGCRARLDGQNGTSYCEKCGERCAKERVHQAPAELNDLRLSNRMRQHTLRLGGVQAKNAHSPHHKVGRSSQRILVSLGPSPLEQLMPPLHLRVATVL